MAKESMKAREVKRAKLVQKYAEKRAKLISEGDYIFSITSIRTPCGSLWTGMKQNGIPGRILR